jgi:hypothetical protein
MDARSVDVKETTGNERRRIREFLIPIVVSLAVVIGAFLYLAVGKGRTVPLLDFAGLAAVPVTIAALAYIVHRQCAWGTFGAFIWGTGLVVALIAFVPLDTLMWYHRFLMIVAGGMVMGLGYLSRNL